MKDEFIIDDVSGIVYSKSSNGYYEPIAVDYNKETGECIIIANDPILLEVYEYVNYYQRKRNNKGKWMSNPIFPYQWGFIFTHVLALLRGTGEERVDAYGRQLT